MWVLIFLELQCTFSNVNAIDVEVQQSSWVELLVIFQDLTFWHTLPNFYYEFADESVHCKNHSSLECCPSTATRRSQI